MKKISISRFMKRKLFLFKPKLIHLIIFLIALALVVAFLNSRIGKLNKQETVLAPTPTITLSPTASPTLSPLETLYQMISELNPNSTIVIDKVVGKFAHVDIHSNSGGGYHLYAMSNNGQWEIIWQGNGDKYAGECQDMVTKYNIPKEFFDCDWKPTPILKPTSTDYYHTKLPLCRQTLSGEIPEKDCLANKLSEIAEAGQECDKAHGMEIKCTTKDSFENLQSCLDQCKDSSDKQTCVNNCPKIDCSQARTDYETLRQKYLDLVSKYCK